MAEILAPARRPLATEFSRGFSGMTTSPVFIEDLEAARENLVTAIAGEMPESHRQFLLSFKRGEPDWPLLGVPSARALPAVQWRQRNLDQLTRDNRAKLIAKLEAVLFPARASGGSNS